MDLVKVQQSAPRQSPEASSSEAFCYHRRRAVRLDTGREGERLYSGTLQIIMADCFAKQQGSTTFDIPPTDSRARIDGLGSERITAKLPSWS